MVIGVEPSVQLGTCAVTLTVCGPSTTLLFTKVRLNTADVWPAGMTVAGGTINLDGSLELRETVTFLPAAVPMPTDPALTSVPADSEALAGKVTDRVAVSLSWTVIVVWLVP